MAATARTRVRVRGAIGPGGAAGDDTGRHSGMGCGGRDGVRLRTGQPLANAGPGGDHVTVRPAVPGRGPAPYTECSPMRLSRLAPAAVLAAGLCLVPAGPMIADD